MADRRVLPPWAVGHRARPSRARWLLRFPGLVDLGLGVRPDPGCVPIRPVFWVRGGRFPARFRRAARGCAARRGVWLHGRRLAPTALGRPISGWLRGKQGRKLEPLGDVVAQHDGGKLGMLGDKQSMLRNGPIKLFPREREIKNPPDSQPGKGQKN